MLRAEQLGWINERIQNKYFGFDKYVIYNDLLTLFDAFEDARIEVQKWQGVQRASLKVINKQDVYILQQECRIEELEKQIEDMKSDN